jgi:hypothetical protein
MSSQQTQFLNLQNLPARLTVEEAAWLLGFSPHDIPILVAAGLLKPFDQPAPNGSRYFAKTILCELKQDANWLSRATKEIMQHWRFKNRKKISEPAPMDGQ